MLCTALSIKGVQGRGRFVFPSQVQWGEKQIPLRWQRLPQHCRDEEGVGEVGGSSLHHEKWLAQPWVHLELKAHRWMKDFSLLPGKNCVEPACLYRSQHFNKGVTLHGAEEGWFTNIYFNLFRSEFSLFAKHLSLVSVCGKLGLQLFGTPAPEGVQQRLGSTSLNISPDSGCHGKPLTDLADKSSSW